MVSGTGTAVVVKTGGLTEYGGIAKELVTKAPETEFEKGLRRFGALMTEVTLFLVVFVFFVNAFFYSGIAEHFGFAAFRRGSCGGFDAGAFAHDNVN